MNLFWSRSVWLHDYDQLLWKTNDHVIIITLSKLGQKNESCNITIGEQSKFEAYINQTVTWSVVSHGDWSCIM